MVAVIKKKAIICALLLLVFLCACTGKPPAAEETTPLPQEEQKTEEISTAPVEQPEPSEVPQEEEIARPSMVFPSAVDDFGNEARLGMPDVDFQRVSTMESKDGYLMTRAGIGIGGMVIDGVLVQMILEAPWNVVSGPGIGTTVEEAKAALGQPDYEYSNCLSWNANPGKLDLFYDEHGVITKIDMASVDDVHLLCKGTREWEAAAWRPAALPAVPVEVSVAEAYLAYPALVNENGQQLRVGMTAEDFEKALGIKLIGEVFYVSPEGSGLLAVVHNGTVWMLSADANWELEGEAGLGDTRETLLSAWGEPDSETEPIPDSHGEVCIASYGIENGSVSFTYDTEQTIITSVQIQAVDGDTMEEMTKEWRMSS